MEEPEAVGRTGHEEQIHRSAQTDELELCACPECGLPAEVRQERDAPHPVGDLVAVRCIQRHWFVGPRERLVA